MLRKRGNLSIAAAAALAAASVGSSAHAADKWFDINGTTDGSGIATNGPHTWSTAVANWNTDPLGGAAGVVEPWAAGDNAFFSAGADATAPFTVNVNGAQTAANMTVEEGTVIISGSAIAIGTGTVTVRNGATLQIPTISNVTQTAGSGGLLLDGGTIRQTNPGNAGSFWDPDGTIRLTANGGTVDYTSSGAGVVSTYGSAAASATIVRDASVPAGTLVTLTKTGVHEFRYQGVGLATSTFDKLVVDQGRFALGFNSSIQDERGYGAVPASFMADQITLRNNSILGNSFTLATLHQNRGITLGVGGGQLSGNFVIPGAITGVGSLTRLSGGLTLGGVNDYTGGFIQNVAGTTTVSAGATLAGPTSTVTLNLGTIALNNTAQTVGGITGTGGTMALSAGHTLTISPAAATTHSFSGVISGATAAVVKEGLGTQALTGTNTYGGGTTVNAGTLQVARMHQSNAVTIAAGAKLQVLDSSPTLPNHPSGDNAFVSRPSTLTIATGGTLDLGNNDLILDYTGTSPAGAIEDLVALGFNGGGWDGTGILSSTAAAEPNFVLAVADNATLLAPFGNAEGQGGPLFAGQDMDLTTVLVKFTHRVDLDLDGLVTSNDAAIFNAFFNEGQPATWQIGDVDYDGVFSSNDAAIFNGFYNEALASVPEPATAGVLALGVLGLLARRRRQPAN